MTQAKRTLYFINDLFGGGAQNGLINLLKADFFKGSDLHVLAMIRGDGSVEAELARYIPADHLHMMSNAEKMKLKHLLVAFIRYPLLLLKLRPSLVILSLPQANLVGRFWGHLLPFFRLYVFEHSTSYARKSYGYLLKLLSLSVTGILSDTARTGEETTRFFLPWRTYKFVELPLYTGQTDPKMVKTDTKLHTPVQLLIAGRLSHAKNHATVFKALHILKGQGVNAHLNIVGNGELQTELEAAVKDLGLTSNVSFLGYLSPWTSQCTKADIYLQPSHREGLCITVVEALSHGMPVIASPRGGMLDYGTEGENMLYADPDSPEDLAGKILFLITDHKLRAKLSHNGPVSMDAHFGLSVTKSKLGAARKALGLA